MLIDNKYNITADNLNELTKKFFSYQVRYKAAIRQVRTRLEILDDEFNLMHKRNPIHHMESRLKSPLSIAEKLNRKHIPVNIENAVKELTDIAGIRVVCSYMDDTYLIAKLLKAQDDIKIIRERDYIKSPKKNGYRSLHLILLVNIYLYDKKVEVPVELQIRTIAMDFWASLEHRLRYKDSLEIPERLNLELIKTANDIADIDRKMQLIYDMVQTINPLSNVDNYYKQFINNQLSGYDTDEGIFSPLNK